jgi:hypothetical protein
MTSLTLLGDTSGSIVLDAPAVSGSTVLTLPTTSGTLALASTIPAFAAYPSAASTNISSSTWTKVTLDTELYDTNSNFASSRFTPTVAGYYQINFTASTGTSAGNAYWHGGAIYKNGSAYAQAFPVFPAGNIQSYTNSIVQLISMNGSTDYLEFYVNVYVASGTPSYGGGATTGTLVSGFLARTA